MPIILDVDWQRSHAAGASPRSLDGKIGELVSIADWGVVGDGSDETVKVQRAFDEAPLGCWLHIPRTPVWILVTDQINFHRPLNLIFDSSSLILGAFDDATKYVLDMRMRVNAFGTGATGDVRGLQLINPRIEVAFGTDGAGALNIEAQDPDEVPSSVDLPLHSVQLHGGFLSVPNASSGHALRIAGNITQLHSIEGVDIFNGIHVDGAADACRFIRNLFFGTRVAIKLEPHVGAFRWLISDNVMVSQDGALYCTGGAQIVFLRNQVETATIYGDNASSYHASVTLDASEYDITTAEFRDNNFNGDTKVLSHIHMRTAAGLNIEGVRIGVNSWGTTKASSAKDIIIADARVRFVDIAECQQPRGVGAQRGGSSKTTNPDVAANTLNIDDLLVIDDSGTGTANVKKTAAALGGADTTHLLNSYTCVTTFRFWRDSRGFVHLTGYIVAPGAGSGTIVGAFPDGFRPTQEERFIIGGVAIQVLANGYLLATTTGAGPVWMAGVSFKAKREVYRPGY